MAKNQRTVKMNKLEKNITLTQIQKEGKRIAFGSQRQMERKRERFKGESAN